MRRTQIAQNHAERLQALAALLAPASVDWSEQRISFKLTEAESRPALPR